MIDFTVGPQSRLTLRPVALMCAHRLICFIEVLPSSVAVQQSCVRTVGVVPITLLASLRAHARVNGNSGPYHQKLTAASSLDAETAVYDVTLVAESSTTSTAPSYTRPCPPLDARPP